MTSPDFIFSVFEKTFKGLSSAPASTQPPLSKTCEKDDRVEGCKEEVLRMMSMMMRRSQMLVSCCSCHFVIETQIGFLRSDTHVTIVHSTLLRLREEIMMAKVMTLQEYGDDDDGDETSPNRQHFGNWAPSTVETIRSTFAKSPPTPPPPNPNPSLIFFWSNPISRILRSQFQGMTISPLFSDNSSGFLGSTSKMLMLPNLKFTSLKFRLTFKNLLVSIFW